MMATESTKVISYKAVCPGGHYWQVAKGHPMFIRAREGALQGRIATCRCDNCPARPKPAPSDSERI